MNAFGRQPVRWAIPALLVVAACIAAAVFGRGGPVGGPSGPGAPPPVAERAAPARPGPAVAPPAGRARGHRRVRPHMPTGTGTRAVLRRALLRGAIGHRQWAAWRHDLVLARRVVPRLEGARRAELASVLGTVEGLAASGRLTASRMPLAFLTLRRNTTVWRTRPFPAPSARLTFGRDPAVFQYFPGRGVQVHALATAGLANALAVPCLRVAEARRGRALARAARFASARRVGSARRVLRPRVPASARGRRGACRPRTLQRRLDRLVALSSRRGGFRAWESLFAYGGGTAPWVSAMTQATAAQALARGADALGDRGYRRVALAALGAFDAAPPLGVSVPMGRGRQFVMYSFAPSLQILNGTLQAVIGLYDVAHLTGARRAWRLFRRGERAARTMVASYDTGAWSRYSLAGRESTLSYHELVTGFLDGLCSRTGRAVYCDRAARFDRYLHEPPLIRLTVPARLREARPAAFSAWVSKVSAAEVTVRDRRGVLLDRTGELPRGRYRYAFTPRRAGRYTVKVTATGPEGRRAVAEAQVRAKAKPKPKPKPEPKPKPKRRRADHAATLGLDAP